MKEISVKESLSRLLAERTALLNGDDLAPLTTQDLAEALSASRNVVSQYLNEWTETGGVVKAGSRPVTFFDREKLQHGYAKPLKQSFFSTIEELRQELKRLEKRSAFDRLVGYGGSLAYCIEQCKAAICYPGGGPRPYGDGKNAHCAINVRIRQGKRDFTGKQPLLTFKLFRVC